MENLFANTHELKGKMKEKIEANQELGLLSKKLATIMLDVPVTFNAKDFELDAPDIPKVTAIFQELEFRRLIDNFTKTFTSGAEATSLANDNPSEKAAPKVTPKEAESAGAGQFNLFGGDPNSATATSDTDSLARKTAETTAHFYQSVASGMATTLFIKNLMSQTSVCFDTETTGLKSVNCRIGWDFIFMGNW